MVARLVASQGSYVTRGNNAAQCRNSLRKHASLQRSHVLDARVHRPRCIAQEQFDLHITQDINVADCTDECKRQDYTNRQATVPYNIESFRLLFIHRFNLLFFGYERA